MQLSFVVEYSNQVRETLSTMIVLLLSCSPGPHASLSILVRALFCEASSTQRCTGSSVSWQFLAWNSLHKFQKKVIFFWTF